MFVELSLDDLSFSSDIRFAHMRDLDTNIIFPLVSGSSVGQVEFKYLSSKKKVLIQACPVIGHVITDTLNFMFLFNNRYPDVDIIVIDSLRPGSDICFQYLHRAKVAIEGSSKASVEIVQINDGNSIAINNFYYVDIDGRHVFSVDSEKIHSYLFYENDKPEVGKKVYVSRVNTRNRKIEYKNSKGIEKFIYDKRVFNEEYLEQKFEELGFDIVYPELFQSLDHQIKFFSNVTHLAGVTGAGLWSILFMPKGSTLIEISTPLLTQGNGMYQVERHTHYQETAVDLGFRVLVINGDDYNQDGSLIAKDLDKVNI